MNELSFVIFIIFNPYPVLTIRFEWSGLAVFAILTNAIILDGSSLPTECVGAQNPDFLFFFASGRPPCLPGTT